MKYVRHYHETIRERAKIKYVLNKVLNVCLNNIAKLS